MEDVGHDHLGLQEGHKSDEINQNSQLTLEPENIVGKSVQSDDRKGKTVSQQPYPHGSSSRLRQRRKIMKRGSRPVSDKQHGR